MKRMEPSKTYSFFFVSDPDNKYFETTCSPSANATNMIDGANFTGITANAQITFHSFTTLADGDFFGKIGETNAPYNLTAIPTDTANRVDVNRSIFLIGHPSATDSTIMAIVGCAYLSHSSTSISTRIVSRKWPSDYEAP